MTVCFWCEPTGRARYIAEVECCNGHRLTVLERIGPRSSYEDDHGYAGVTFRRGDVTWPAACAECGVPLVILDYVPEDGEEPEHYAYDMIGGSMEYRRTDTGETTWRIHEFGPGTMWDFAAIGLPPSIYPPKHDGRHLAAITPDGHTWRMDAEASNCTRPGEDHDCWCRHGEPPLLTVDKNPEPGRSTCAAGAGSIQTSAWHGFLRNGRFESV